MNVFKKILFLAVIANVFFSVAVFAAPGDGTAPAGEEPATLKRDIELLQPFPEEEAIKTDKGAISIVEQVVKKVYLFGSALVSVVAVLWIIIGGYEIMFSGALGSGSNSNGKEKITQALLGLVILFLAALILNMINPDFFTLRYDSAAPGGLGK